MSAQQLVSVIIPAYNAAPYIRETVGSVLAQTYSNFELIIVNDGSKDNTLEVLRQIETEDERITVLTKDNSGVCDTRNLGYEKSKGEFHTFLDADDVWEPAFLEKCMELFQQQPEVGAVYSKVQHINEHSKKLDEYIEANTIASVNDVLEWKPGYVASMGCTIYKRSIIDQVGLFDNRLSTAADQDFHLRIASITPIVALNEVLFYYRIHGNNMHQNIEVMEKDHLLVFNKAVENGYFENKKFQRKCFANLYKILAGSWWKVGNNKRKGLKFAFKSVLTYPGIVKEFF